MRRPSGVEDVRVVVVSHRRPEEQTQRVEGQKDLSHAHVIGRLPFPPCVSVDAIVRRALQESVAVATRTEYYISEPVQSLQHNLETDKYPIT